VQFQQPLTFLNVGFVSRQIFRVFRVDQEDFHAVFFQNVVKGNPIHAGRLHCHRLDSMTHQPFRQASQILGKAAEFPHMVVSRFGDIATKWEALPTSIPAAFGWMTSKPGSSTEAKHRRNERGFLSPADRGI